MKNIINFLKKIGQQINWPLILCLILMVGLRFYPVFFGKTLFFGDNYSLMVPGKLFTAEGLKNGQLPFWNPYIFSGLPWIQDINQSVIYFSSWFFSWWPPAIALNVTLIIHLVIAMLGMWKLAGDWTTRSWLKILAGFGWAYSTQVTGSLNNIATLQSVVWTPLIIYWGGKIFKNEQAKWWLALTVLLQFLGGYPQHVLYSVICAVAYSLVGWWLDLPTGQNLLEKKWVTNWLQTWIKTIVLVLLISALAWVPFVEVLRQSTRMIQTDEQAQMGSLQPAMLIKAGLAYFFDKPTFGVRWGPAWNGEPNMVWYQGWIVSLIMIWVLFDSVINRQKSNENDKRQKVIWGLAGISGLTIILSLGSFLPGFELIQKIIPLFRIARSPSTLLMITNISLWLWAVIAWEKYLSINVISNQQKLFQKIILAVGMVGLMLAIVNWWWLLKSPLNWWQTLNTLTRGKLLMSAFHTLERDQLIGAMIFENLVVCFGLLVTGWSLILLKKYWLLLIIVVIDLWYSTQAMLIFGPNKLYSVDNFSIAPNNYIAPSLKTNDGQNYRVLTRDNNKPYADFRTYWQALAIRQPFSDSFITKTEMKNYNSLAHLRDGYVPNWNLVQQVPLVHGFTTLLPNDYYQIWHQSTNININNDGTQINFLDQLDLSNPSTRQLLSDWSVRYYLVDYAFEVKEDVKVETGSKPLYAKDLWMLRWWPETLPRFRDDFGDYLQTDKIYETPNQIKMLIENNPTDMRTGQPRKISNYLIIADRYDKNWIATINDQRVEVENYQGMRRIKLQTGYNQVVLRYEPIWFYVGVMVSGLTLLIGGGWMLWQNFSFAKNKNSE